MRGCDHGIMTCNVDINVGPKVPWHLKNGESTDYGYLRELAFCGSGQICNVAGSRVKEGKAAKARVGLVCFFTIVSLARAYT